MIQTPIPQISIPSDAVMMRDGKAVTTSRKVAETFGKQHRNVIQSIERLDCSPEFGMLNFQHTPYIEPQNGQTYKEYLITRDGFTFLVMGFTGKAAAKFKEAYINAFNKMEAQMQTPSNQIMHTILETVNLIKAQGEQLLFHRNRIDQHTSAIELQTALIEKQAEAITMQTKEIEAQSKRIDAIEGKNSRAWKPVQAPKVSSGKSKPRYRLVHEIKPQMHINFIEKAFAIFPHRSRKGLIAGMLRAFDQLHAPYKLADANQFVKFYVENGYLYKKRSESDPRNMLYYKNYDDKSIAPGPPKEAEVPKAKKGARGDPKTNLANMIAEGAAQIPWKPVLEKMEIGEHFEFPRSMMSNLKGSIWKQHHSKGTKRFSMVDNPKKEGWMKCFRIV